MIMYVSTNVIRRVHQVTMIFFQQGPQEFVSLNCHLIASVTVPCSIPEKNAHSSGGGIVFDPFWPRCEY